MRIIKFTHSCVRIESNGRVLVVDPGIWSEPGALIGADAVLVTHEHVDHVDTLRVRGVGAPLYAPEGVPEAVQVRAGDEFDAAGFRIRAVGGRHATVYGDQPVCVNLGYVIDDHIYHPGDSLFVPDAAIETLFVPIQASWLKTAEAIDFVRAIDPRRTIPIHEGQVNERGLAALNHNIAEHTANGYRYVAPRAEV